MNIRIGFAIIIAFMAFGQGQVEGSYSACLRLCGDYMPLPPLPPAIALGGRTSYIRDPPPRKAIRNIDIFRGPRGGGSGSSKGPICFDYGCDNRVPPRPFTGDFDPPPRRFPAYGTIDVFPKPPRRGGGSKGPICFDYGCDNRVPPPRFTGYRW